MEERVLPTEEAADAKARRPGCVACVWGAGEAHAARLKQMSKEDHGRKEAERPVDPIRTSQARKGLSVLLSCEG